jgi:hypothetical protein
MTSTAASLQILLYHLDPSLQGELVPILAESGLGVESSECAENPSLVFCASDPETVAQALSSYPGRPVVVVSRLPEVSGWLDALEAGAADYCAAPFERLPMRWILETSLGKRTCKAAA